MGCFWNSYSTEGTRDRLDSLCRSWGVGRGEAVRILMEQAAGNFARKRHALWQPLNAIRFRCAELRRPCCRPRDQADAIDRSVGEAETIMSRP